MWFIAMYGTALGLAAAARTRAAVAWLTHATPRVAQSTVEYAIVAAVIAVIAIAAVNGLREPLISAFTNIANCVSGAMGSGGTCR